MEIKHLLEKAVKDRIVQVALDVAVEMENR